MRLFEQRGIRFDHVDFNLGWIIYRVYTGNLDKLCDELEAAGWSFLFMCHTCDGVFIRQTPDFRSDYEPPSSTEDDSEGEGELGETTETFPEGDS